MKKWLMYALIADIILLLLVIFRLIMWARHKHEPGLFAMLNVRLFIAYAVILTFILIILIIFLKHK